MNLSVVMPILNRPLFTLRALWYLNKIGFPWKLIVADGSVDPTIERILNDKSLFPRLDYSHFRRADVSPNAFIRKCHIALSMVETPFVLMFENDDFLFPRAIERSLTFLAAHPDYVAAGGAVAGFYLDEPQAGDPFAWIIGKPATWHVIYGLLDCSAESSTSRVLDHIDHYFPTYYCVHRTGVLREAYEFIAETVYNELALHELFLSCHTLLAGKIRTFGSEIGYLRELNLGAPDLRPYSELAISPRFDLDFRRIVDHFPSRLERDPAGPKGVAAELPRLLRQRMAEFVRRVCLGTIYHGSPPGPPETVLNELTGWGATDADLAAVRAELGLVCEVLVDRQFRTFATAVAPEYLKPGRG